MYRLHWTKQNPHLPPCIPSKSKAKTAQNPLPFRFIAGCTAGCFPIYTTGPAHREQLTFQKKGTQFYPADELQAMGDAKFLYLQNMHEFCDLPRDRFIDEITDFYHEINMLHPFRDGNGRTQRLFFTLLIRRAGHNISFADCDTDFLMMATIFAAQGIKDHLRQFFDASII